MHLIHTNVALVVICRINKFIGMKYFQYEIFTTLGVIYVATNNL